VPGTEHGDHLGVLRLDFGGDADSLREVSRQEWFDTFDARRLNVIHQQERKDGPPTSWPLTMSLKSPSLPVRSFTRW